MAEIVLRGVTKRFPDGTLAVHGVDLAVRDGEFFILVGPSGCGKSTVLHLIAGLEDLTEGEVVVDGRVVNDLDPKDRNMAMVFQTYAIYPHLTVAGNLAFPLEVARVERDEIRRRVEEAAAILGLTAVLDRRPRQLSGGQRQRVAMGRAIIRKPRAFLMDEPLSNLDAALRLRMRAEIARLHRRVGTTTVYVTHDQTEAMTLGDRIAVMRHGEIQQVGTPRELYSGPANLFVAGFIGSPAMNFLPAVLDGERVVFGPCAPARAGRPVVAGIRPEHLAPAEPGADPREILEVRVELVEWLGPDLYAHGELEISGAEPIRRMRREHELPGADADEPLVVARLDPSSPVRAGDRLALHADPGRIHLFDAAGGATLARATSPRRQAAEGERRPISFGSSDPGSPER